MPWVACHRVTAVSLIPFAVYFIAVKNVLTIYPPKNAINVYILLPKPVDDTFLIILFILLCSCFVTDYFKFL